MAKSRKTKKESGWEASAAKTAAAVGVSRTVLTGYLAEGCPEKTARGYDVEAIKRWRADNKSEPRGVDASPASLLSERLKIAQAREREARAELVELQLKLERGEFVSKEEVKEWDLARVAFIRRGLWELPRVFADLLVGLNRSEIEAVARKRIKDLFEKFARM